MRAYHSPSSIALARRCERAWAGVYLEGRRDPRIAYEECTKDTPSRIRASSLGVAVHAVLERYVRGERPDWFASLPAQVALSGLHHMPNPALIPAGRSFPEEPIGDVPLPPGGEAHAPPVAMRHAGILWAGYRDWLVAPPTRELARLGVIAPDGWVLYDYKSTSDIARWALTPAKLASDVQASLYALDVSALIGGVRLVPARWLYLETKAVRRSHPVDALIEISHAQDTIGPCAELARKLDTLASAEDAQPNPLACSDYGPPGKNNCPHARVNGGTCDAKRSLATLIKLNQKPKKETQVMPMDPETKARFDAARAAVKSDADEPAQAAASRRGRPPAQPAAEAPATAEAAAPAAAPRQRRVAASSPPPAEAAPLSQAATLANLAGELAAVDAARDGILAKIRASIG